MSVNQKGQALIESVFVLPFLFGLLSLVLVGFLSWVSHYFVDYTLYKASLCLASSNISKQCRSQMKTSLELIPFSKFSIQRFYRDSKSISIFVDYTQLGRKNIRYTQNLQLPLSSKHFEEAL